MFNRSRRKIILSIMGSLILLFAVTLTVILLASWQEIRGRDAEMLDRYAELYVPEAMAEAAQEGSDGQGTPGEVPPPDPGEMPSDADETPKNPGEPKMNGGPGRTLEKRPADRGPDFQLSTFYAVALAEDGSVIEVDNGEKDIYSDDELAETARSILAGNRTSGREGTLSYVVAVRPGYTLVAFMDNTVTENSMNTLLRNFLIVGGAAIAALFFIALLLSKRIIRPLEENDRRQKQFISDASHELKTPVAVIGTNAELLEGEIGQNEWLANIRYENERMGGLVKQLLDLSRAENTEAAKEPVDFSRVVTGETLALDALAFDNGREFRSDIADGITLTGSRTQLTQLVSVLLDNAIRHSTGKEITVSLKRQGHHAVLEVENEGGEIPPEKQAHLFERFYRVDEARGGDEAHYGLGLAIARAVAEKHGGTIGVACAGGKVRFTVSIPEK